jgi:hypothetical protein
LIFASYRLSLFFEVSFSETPITGRPEEPSVSPPRLKPAGANHTSELASDEANVPRATTEGGTQSNPPAIVSLT